MTEPTRRQLMVLVERAIRPVQASATRKRRMREELLAHLNAVFDEEIAKTGDEPAALQACADRFGDPVELTHQLQISIPFSDHIRSSIDRWWFKPGESRLLRAFRRAIACQLATFILLLPLVGKVVSLSTSLVYIAVTFIPYVFMTLLAEWMYHTVYRPEKPSWSSILLIAIVSSLLFTTFCLIVMFLGGGWPTIDWMDSILIAVFGFLWLPVSFGTLAKLNAERTRYLEQWANLPV